MKQFALIIIVAVSSLLLGVFTTLYFAQRSSGRFVVEQIQLTRASLSVESMRWLAKKDLLRAEETLYSDLGLLLSDRRSEFQSVWPLEYPVFLGFGISGTKLSSEEFTRKQEKALIFSRLAYLKDLQGKTTEATTIYNEVASVLGGDAETWRQKTAAAVETFAK